MKGVRLKGGEGGKIEGDKIDIRMGVCAGQKKNIHIL